MGRAARNVRGKAILYADRETGSMQRAISETNRRRDKQLAYNEEHRIVPATIRKNVRDIMEGARSIAGGRRRKRAGPAGRPMPKLSADEALKRVAVLEKQMYRHARDLEFEAAAKLRDEIAQLRQHGFDLPGRDRPKTASGGS
jgi:excinuclease ABC subunit B